MSEPSHRAASTALLSAALGGLLCFGVSCGSSSDSGKSNGDVGASSDGDAKGEASTDATVDAATDAVSEAATDSAVTPDAVAEADSALPTDTTPDGDTACDVVDAPEVTSTVSDPGMTLDDFTAMCSALGGFIEIHPECGGHNSCKGLSYDQLTGVLTHHTCAGMNTCQGFSCILP